MIDIDQIIGKSGGTKGCFWEIIAEEDRGKTKYWPSIKDGRHLSPFQADYWENKVEVERETIRMIVAGNPIAAEEPISEMLGCKCCAVGPTTLDIYIEEALDV